MRQRKFISLLGSAAAAWPFAARAQKGEQLRRVGVLMNGNERDQYTERTSRPLCRRFSDWVGWRGRIVRIDLRWPPAAPERIGAYAAELVGMTPDVILCSGSASLDALLRTTRSIKAVSVLVSDPVAQGFVKTWRIRAATSQAFPRSSRLRPANGSICSSRHRPA